MTRRCGDISRPPWRRSSSRIAGKRAAGVGKLDADPFLDAQDWEIEGVEVAVRDTAAGKARATVSFKNLGQPQTVILDLVKLKQDWRIADITWDRKATLRGLLTGKKRHRPVTATERMANRFYRLSLTSAATSCESQKDQLCRGDLRGSR